MKRTFCLAALAASLGITQAQAPDPANVHLRGGRFAPLTYSGMTPEQKTMLDHLLNGERHGATDGPFNVLLRSPETGDLVQSLGARVRFHTELPDKLRELAIITTARFWTVQFEWAAHRRAAEQAGLSPAIVQAIADGKRPSGLDPEETSIYNFTTELLTTKQVSDAAFQDAVSRFGERRVVNLITLVGYYQMVAMLLNVDRYPMANGAQPELKSLP